MIFSPENIQLRLRSQPFIPLQIVTTTGQTYNIDHPNLVFVTLSFLEVGTPSRDNENLADLVTRVAIAHITELRDLPARTPLRSANGPPA